MKLIAKNAMNLLLVSMALIATHSTAQTVTTYDELFKRVGATQTIATLGVDALGDKFNLYDGSLEFVQTDVSLPGNNALPVSLSRRFTTNEDKILRGHFGDWDIELPRIQGSFANQRASGNYGWTVAAEAADMYKRCSRFGEPPEAHAQADGGMFDAGEFWNGNSIYMPGQGSEQLLWRSTTNTKAPSTTTEWPIVTKGGWQISCLSNIANAKANTNIQGEGMLARSPDGVVYRFDWLVERPMSSVEKPVIALSRRPRTLTNNYLLVRGEFWLLPSSATDRFGNKITYNYDAANPMRLNSITSTDGRTLSITYDSTSTAPNYRISSVSDGTRAWTYGYTNGSLSSVSLNDGSAWTISLDTIKGNPKYTDGSSPSCTSDGAFAANPKTGFIINPSGLRGDFTTETKVNRRSYVIEDCPTGRPATYPRTFLSRALTQKKLSGPGMSAITWSFTREAGVASGAACAANCGGTKAVVVTDNLGRATRHVFGTSFQSNEGQLLTRQDGWNANTSTAISTTQYSYGKWADGGGQPYPDKVGFAYAIGDNFSAINHTPQKSKTITQQGVTFTWTANSFDVFARPTSVTRSSTLGYSRSENTKYKDLIGTSASPQWLLGQVEELREGATVGSGTLIEQNTFHATTAALLTSKRFGWRTQSLDYNPDGTVKSVKDAADRETKLSSYMRGIPQRIDYPDATFAKAVVNNIGRIISVTNEFGSTTSYGYDAMGRLAGITYPTGDAVTYNSTTISFKPNTVAAYGLPAGHWLQTVVTGNLTVQTYFDALWRPVVSRRVDTGTSANRFVVKCQWSSNNPQLWHLNFPHPSHARSIRWSRNSNA